MRFIILCHPRAGASFLQGLLDSHPQISIPDTVGIFNLRELPHMDLRYALANPWEYYNTKMSDRTRPGVKAVGCSLFYYDGCGLDHFNLAASEAVVREYSVEIRRKQDALYEKYISEHGTAVTSRFYDVWQKLSADKDLRVIHLRRRNKMDLFLSLIQAAVTGKFLMCRSPALYATPPTEVQPHHFISVCRDLIAGEEYIPKQFKKCPVHEVYYEDLVHNQAEAIGPVLDFLNVDRKPPLKCRFKKILAGPPQTWMSNFYQFVGDLLEDKHWWQYAADMLPDETVTPPRTPAPENTAYHLPDS